MTTPDQTTTAVVTVMVGIVPLIDSDTLFGAIAGSLFYVMLDTDTPILKRLVFMLTSLYLGYIFAEPIATRYDISHLGIPAFIVALLVTGFSATLLNKIKSADLVGFIRGILKK